MNVSSRMRESEIQDAVRLELGDVRKYPELVLWRNNVGQMIDKDGRRVVFGVGGKGAADLLGLWSGRFVAIELKTDRGRQTDEQRRFELLIQSKGGVYVVLRSVEEARQWAASMRSKAA
ncbi:MAG: hypothetical protein AB7E70_19660 [Hyphomicrobiaceae bacterium]